ncbi:hypothetical protein Tco_0255882 [Tanacetum coccineum]
MDYLLKRRWSTLDKKRSRIMIKAIDKLQLERRLMRNLEKFVGGREYEEDFRLLERTIWLFVMDYKLSETLSCCLVLKTVVMDSVTQCTTLPNHSRNHRLILKDLQLKMEILLEQHQQALGSVFCDPTRYRTCDTGISIRFQLMN